MIDKRLYNDLNQVRVTLPLAGTIIGMLVIACSIGGFISAFGRDGVACLGWVLVGALGMLVVTTAAWAQAGRITRGLGCRAGWPQL